MDLRHPPMAHPPPSGIDATVLYSCAAGREHALDERDRRDLLHSLVLHSARRDGERARCRCGHPVANARQRNVRPERAPIEREAVRGARLLDVVVHELEARILLHTHPYDARRPKVRKGAQPAEAQVERVVARPHGRDRGLDRLRGAPGLLTEELDRQVQVRLPHPARVRGSISHWRGGLIDRASLARAQLKCEKETHCPRDR